MASQDKTNGILEKSEEYYNTLLDKDLLHLSNHYKEIVKIAAEKENQQIYLFEQQKVDLLLHSSNIIRSSENLLSLINELKNCVLNNDFESMNQIIDFKREEIEINKLSDAKMTEIIDDILNKNI